KKVASLSHPIWNFPFCYFFLKLPNTYPTRKIFETQQETYENTERISLVSSFMACLFLGAYACIDTINGYSSKFGGKAWKASSCTCCCWFYCILFYWFY
ncbi:hypothetical protein Gotur_028499, partial [Gossypium turneri]